MQKNILLITPPFTQLNTPYPATAYIKGFLNTQDIGAAQMDLGIDTILAIFSKEGLTTLFESIKNSITDHSENAQRIYTLRSVYINTIDPVIQFLQDSDPTLSHLICERQFLPEASKFQQLEDVEWAFGTMGIRDKARHIATLYLEDISDFIVEAVDPNFGFSRYAERLSMSAKSFDEINKAVENDSSFICKIMYNLLDDKIKKVNPNVIGFSVPFPGNLFAALKCGQWIKRHHPEIKIIMGGGFPNTELRSLTDPRIFKYIDFITLDDGETPLQQLLSYLKNEIDITMLKRTFSLVDNEVVYHNGSIFPDIKQENVGTPDYHGLHLKKYLSVIQLTNPMHRLWSDGRWNKLTMAHGCYWGKCTFCDISLDYIKNYEASSAELIVDRMERLIAQTGERGFHFVDEAAPPALMKAVAIAILRRNLIVSWWTNIRFEKSFNYDLCRLLASSGCIAISGGLEVASDRLLKLIAKGVTIEQVSQVNNNFNKAGIMVHAYLMYGFPTQTAQETIDSLEVVRQMFETGVLQSAFWHRFAMTAHSPVGMFPDKFKVSILNEEEGTFANNDLEHNDPEGAEHDRFSFGLKKSLFNYMHGICFDHPLQNWFDHEVPSTSISADLIQNYIKGEEIRSVKPSHIMLWIGGPSFYNHDSATLIVTSKNETHNLNCSPEIGEWLSEILNKLNYDKPTSFKALEAQYLKAGFDDFTLFWFGKEMEELKSIGLLYV